MAIPNASGEAGRGRRLVALAAVVAGEVSFRESDDGLRAGAAAEPRTRDVPRAGAVPDAEDPAEVSEVPEPLEPAEPRVSANAIGIAATAEPTPNATANAPTRPTTRAKPAGSVTDHRRYSIARTCHFDPRRTALTDWIGCADGIEGSPHIR